MYSIGFWFLSFPHLFCNFYWHCTDTFHCSFQSGAAFVLRGNLNCLLFCIWHFIIETCRAPSLSCSALISMQCRNIYYDCFSGYSSKFHCFSGLFFQALQLCCRYHLHFLALCISSSAALSMAMWWPWNPTSLLSRSSFGTFGLAPPVMLQVCSFRPYQCYHCLLYLDVGFIVTL